MYDLQYSMYKKSCPFLYRYLHIKLDFLQDDMNSMHNTNNFVSNFKYPNAKDTNKSFKKRAPYVQNSGPFLQTY